MAQENKWYTKTSGIIFLLFVFFPVGVYLMWKYSPWGFKTKKIVSGMLAVIVVLALVSNKLSPSSNVVGINTMIISPTLIPEPTIRPGAITLDSLAYNIVQFNPKQQGDRYIGFLKDGKSNIILIGDKNNFTSIELSLNRLGNSSMKADDISSLISRLTHDIAPAWNDADSWLIAAYKYFSTSKDEVLMKKIDIDSKTITMTYDRETANLTFLVEVKQ